MMRKAPCESQRLGKKSCRAVLGAPACGIEMLSGSHGLCSQVPSLPLVAWLNVVLPVGAAGGLCHLYSLWVPGGRVGPRDACGILPAGGDLLGMRWHVVYVEACQGMWMLCWTFKHVCLQEGPRWVLLMACVLPCPLGLPLLLTPLWPSRYKFHVPEPLLDPSRCGERKGSCLLCVSRGAWIKPNSSERGKEGAKCRNLMFVTWLGATASRAQGILGDNAPSGWYWADSWAQQGPTLSLWFPQVHISMCQLCLAAPILPSLGCCLFPTVLQALRMCVVF